MVSLDPTQNGAPLHQTRSFLRTLWIYGPMLAWMIFIFAASTDLFSASHTGYLLEPILKTIVPNIKESTIEQIHFLVRKAGHFSEYGLLALLTARAFSLTETLGIKYHWFLWSLAFVAFYSLTDEYHQSFVPSRTASIYDSMIDTAGGLTLLAVYFLFRLRSTRKRIL
jgi:VanZ family protein